MNTNYDNGINSYKGETPLAKEPINKTIQAATGVASENIRVPTTPPVNKRLPSRFTHGTKKIVPLVLEPRKMVRTNSSDVQKGPYETIQNWVELLAKEIATIEQLPEEARQQHSETFEALKEISSLLELYLKYSSAMQQSGSSKIHMDLETIDLKQLFEHSVRMCNLILNQKNKDSVSGNQKKQIELEFLTDVDSIDCVSCKMALFSILDNIIGNAAKYSKSFIKLVVEATAEDSGGKPTQLRIQVVNDGDDIPEEKLKQMGEYFNNKGDTAYYGTGIGVPVTMENVQGLGGKFQIMNLSQTTYNGTDAKVRECKTGVCAQVDIPIQADPKVVEENYKIPSTIPPEKAPAKMAHDIRNQMGALWYLVDTLTEGETKPLSHRLARIVENLENIGEDILISNSEQKAQLKDARIFSDFVAKQVAIMQDKARRSGSGEVKSNLLDVPSDLCLAIDEDKLSRLIQRTESYLRSSLPADKQATVTVTSKPLNEQNRVMIQLKGPITTKMSKVAVGDLKSTKDDASLDEFDIGLQSIAQQVKQLGGSLIIDPKKRNKLTMGFSFPTATLAKASQQVAIPLNAPDVSACFQAKTALSPTQLPPTLKESRILVLDDTKMHFMSLRSVGKECGEFKWAATPREALTALASGRYHAILIDNELAPDKSKKEELSVSSSDDISRLEFTQNGPIDSIKGMDLVEYLHGLPEGHILKHIPIMFISGMNKTDLDKEYQGSPAFQRLQSFNPKPFNIAQIKDDLSKMLSDPQNAHYLAQIPPVSGAEPKV